MTLKKHADRLQSTLQSTTVSVEPKKKKKKISVEDLEVTDPQQIEDIISIAQEMIDDTDVHVELDLEVIRETGTNIIFDIERTSANCFVYYVKGEIAGFLVASCAKSLYCRRIEAAQQLWFCRPKYRGSRAGIMLLRAYERWARLNGAHHIYTGTINGYSAAETAKLLERNGYPRKGTLHLKVI